MGEVIRHNCGIAVAHTLHDTYSFMKSLQHRGREAAGIAAIGVDSIDVIKWRGEISRFDVHTLHQIFPGHRYQTFMGHVRYATTGRKEKILQDAHPHTIGGKIFHRDNHVLISNCEAAIVHNGHVNGNCLEQVADSELSTGCDSERLLHFFTRNDELQLLRAIPHAYTAAIATRGRNEIVILRDPLGMHPGVLGWKDGKYCVVSEDVALQDNGGKLIETLKPGSAYYLSPHSKPRDASVINLSQKAHCMFEFQYLMNQLTSSDGVYVQRHRQLLGIQLAQELKPDDADIVTQVPHCPEIAARAYGEHTNIPFHNIFYKPRKERSFQGSTAPDRERSIYENLYLRPGMEEQLEGKTVVVIEDSIVRGNVLNRVHELLFNQAHVKKAYVASYTPPLCITGQDGVDRGCLFGVDMPPTPLAGDTYVARGRTPEEINQAVRMNVHYMSMEGLLSVFEQSGISGDNLCTYCLGGPHPLPISTTPDL